jgi:hypothetical protein
MKYAHETNFRTEIKGVFETIFDKILELVNGQIKAVLGTSGKDIKVLSSASIQLTDLDNTSSRRARIE